MGTLGYGCFLKQQSGATRIPVISVWETAAKSDPLLLMPCGGWALSAGALPSDIERGLAAGFAAYLTKPVDVDRFLDAIDDALPADTLEARQAPASSRMSA